MRALVTGATGFVGRHLVAHLAVAGDEVTVSEAEITEPDALEADFGGTRPDAVYHLAAQADVRASFVDPATTLRINVEGTLNVLEAARRAGAGRIVVVSSADVYGRVEPEDLPVDEASAMLPVTPYGASKAAAEMVCVQAGLGRGLDVVRARAFNHLGPGQSDRFVAAALASRVAANERTGAEEVRVGNLQARRDFTDVRDVVRAYRMLATDGAPGEAYNVCSGAACRISDLAEALIARARHPMRLVADGELLRPVDVAEVRGDPSKLHAATGWRPEVPMEKTLDDLLDYWRCALAEPGPPDHGSKPKAGSGPHDGGKPKAGSGPHDGGKPKAGSGPHDGGKPKAGSQPPCRGDSQ